MTKLKHTKEKKGWVGLGYMINIFLKNFNPKFTPRSSYTTTTMRIEERATKAEMTFGKGPTGPLRSSPHQQARRDWGK
jgi:hypothetical protein